MVHDLENVHVLERQPIDLEPTISSFLFVVDIAPGDASLRPSPHGFGRLS
jgi:hypothetical protein